MSLPHGRTLESREYDRRMIALYERSEGGVLPDDATLRRQEFDLNVDHTLGVDFPADRRNALWSAQKRAIRWHLPLALMAYAQKALGSRRPVETLIYKKLVREFGKVLTPQELSAFLNLPPDAVSPTVQPPAA